MGGSSSSQAPPQIIYQPKIVDKTDEVRAKEEARIRAELEQKRLAEQREQGIRDKQLQDKLEALAASRSKLATYTLGSASGSANMFKGLDVSDIDRLRIAVFGPTGSGKSCFINTCVRTITQSNKGPANPQHLGGEGTIVLEDFLDEFFFNLVDTRGFFSHDCDEIQEFMCIVNGQIRSSELIHRGDAAQEQHQQAAQIQVPFSSRIHAVILVIKANDPRLQNDTLVQYMKVPREYLRAQGMTAITVVTHEDTLKDEEAKQEALTAASRATGSPANQTFFITNYTKDFCEQNPDTEVQAIMVMDYALRAAERFLKIFKQREQYTKAPAPAALSPSGTALSASGAPLAASGISNFSIKVVSKLKDDTLEVPYEITSQYTCQQLLESIQRRFRLGNLADYYLSNANGVELVPSSNVSQALHGETTIYLNSY